MILNRERSLMSDVIDLIGGLIAQRKIHLVYGLVLGRDEIEMEFCMHNPKAEDTKALPQIYL